MKREDVKNKIPGITDEQLNWIMQENGADINREKSAATALQTQLDNANAQLKTAQDGLKAFDGVDVAGLQEQVTKLKADMKTQAEGFAFDNALDAAIPGQKGPQRQGSACFAGSGRPEGLCRPRYRHCKGTGRCRKGQPMGVRRGRCSRCGRGLHRSRARCTARQRERWCGSRFQIPEP